MVPNPLPLTSIVIFLKHVREVLKPMGVNCNPIKMISTKSAYADGISTFVLSLRYTVWKTNIQNGITKSLSSFCWPSYIMIFYQFCIHLQNETEL